MTNVGLQALGCLYWELLVLREMFAKVVILVIAADH